MPNLDKYAWVKNVNNLSVYHGTSCDSISPDLQQHTTYPLAVDGKIGFVPVPTHILPQYLYTVKNRIFNLLHAVYTHNPHPLLLETQKRI